MDWFALLPHDLYLADDITKIDELRIDHPILWLIMTEPSSRRYGSDLIAKKLGWPHDIVLAKLRGYKQDGILIDSESPKARTLVWKLTLDGSVTLNAEDTTLITLRLLWLDQRNQVDLDVAKRGE